MKLLLHDTLITAPLVHPFSAGWIETSVAWEALPALTAADIDDRTSALLPASEIALLHTSHAVVPEIAVIAEGQGPIAMRVPVRPDEVEGGPVRLYDVSGTAEILARATVEPFYGIASREWLRADHAEAQVVIVEGAEALRAPEVGFSENLVRAWFILTGQPLVSHLLVVPTSADFGPVRDVMAEAKRIGHERRRDLRKAAAERYDVDRELLTELAASARYSLNEADRRALMTLLQRGNKGSSYPYTWEITYLGDSVEETKT